MSMNRLQFDESLPGGFSNHKATGELPKVLPYPLRLNLGCGKDFRDGFINIDLYSDNPYVVNMDIRNLEFDDNSVDTILASDILEHFSHREVDRLLSEWARVLRPGGELIVRCPNLKLQIAAYVRGDWNADIASYMIFGGQTNPGDYHCVGFDHDSITNHLKKAGFEIVSIEDHDFPQSSGFINLNMTVIAKKEEEQQPFSFKLDLTADNNELSNFDFSLDIDEPKGTNIPASANDLLSKIESIATTAFVTTVVENEENQNEEQTENITEIAEASDEISSEEAEEQSNNALFDIVVNDDEAETDLELNIVWEGSQFVYHSLALINREHCNNLIDAEVANITIIPFEDDRFAPEGNDKYIKLAKNDIRIKAEVSKAVSDLPYAWIRHQWPLKQEPPKGAKWIIMQPWEFTSLRKDMADTMKSANEIWTPSNYSRQAFINSGISFDKVQVIPNGIDPSLFKPEGKAYKLNTKKNFKFLFVGGTIFRKGIDILIESYVKAFTADDDVCLVIKDMGGDSFYKGQTAKQQILDLQNNPNAPEIIYIDEMMPEAAIAELYRACNVFVCPYRGEGFSLPTLEAMACGLPVIVTNGGATDDFVSDTFAWLIDAEPRSVGDNFAGQALVEEAFVLEPSKQHLMEIMQKIHKDPAEVISRGIIASATARKYWTWKRASLKVLSRLDKIYGTDMSSKAQNRLFDLEDSYIKVGIAENEMNYENIDEAIELYKSVLDDDLSDKYKIHVLNRLAFISMQDEEYEKTAEYLDKSAAIDNTHPDTLYLQSKLFLINEKYVEAFETITPALESWKDSKYLSSAGLYLDDLLCHTADIMLEMDDLDGANQIYTTALEYNPNNPRVCFGAGMCFKKAGMPEDAKTMFEWAIRIDPRYEDAKFELTAIEKLL